MRGPAEDGPCERPSGDGHCGGGAAEDTCLALRCLWLPGLRLQETAHLTLGSAGDRPVQRIELCRTGSALISTLVDAEFDWFQPLPQ